ncbi:hypothetical protein TNCV_4680831, partial [Trichonephila clavipes]
DIWQHGFYDEYFSGDFSHFDRIAEFCSEKVVDCRRMSGKKKFSFQEAMDLLQRLPYESSDAPTDDSSDEKVPVNSVLEFSSDSEEDDQEMEQDPGCSNSC